MVFAPPIFFCHFQNPKFPRVGISLKQREKNTAYDETPNPKEIVMDKPTIEIKVKALAKHVRSNLPFYAVATIAALSLNGNRVNAKHFNTFLRENGLDPDEFWI